MNSNRVMVALATVGALALAACGSKFEAGTALPIALDPQYTGGKSATGKFHTAASEDGEIQKLKDRIDGTRPGNLKLAESIRQARITLLDAKDRPTEKGAEKVKVQIVIGAPYEKHERTLEFRADLGKERSPLFKVAKTPTLPNYSLSGGCSDALCRKVILVIRNHDTSSSTGPAPVVAEAGLIYREAEGRVQAKPNAALREQKGASKAQALLRAYESEKTEKMTLLEVAWGRSDFTLDLSAAKACIRGPLVETNDADEPLTGACGAQPLSADFTLSLVGNNNKGGFIIKAAQGDAAVFLTVDTGSATTTADEAGDDDGSWSPPTDQMFIPVDFKHPATRSWEKDRNMTDIKEGIARWSKSSKNLQEFLDRLQPNLKLIVPALTRAGAPSEVIFILAIESRYFKDDGFPIETSHVGALGPWQFMPGTARQFGLKTKPCDERGNLAKSTAAAGRYFKLLFDMFPEDPKLAIMSYNWGQGNVDDAVKCLQKKDCLKKMLARKGQSHRLEEIQNLGFNFWAVKRFNMAPAESLNYVVNFLSAQFVGREPTRYGLKLTDPKSNPYPVAPNRCQ